MIHELDPADHLALLAAARRLVGARERMVTREDLYQVGFLALLMSRARADAIWTTHVRPAAIVARRGMIDFLRKFMRRDAFEPVPLAGGDLIGDYVELEGGRTEDVRARRPSELLDRDAEETLEVATRGLGLVDSDLARARYLEGRTYAESGRVVGLSESGAFLRLREVGAKVRANLEAAA